MNTPYEYIFLTHPVYTPYQHTLSTHPLNTPSSMHSPSQKYGNYYIDDCHPRAVPPLGDPLTLILTIIYAPIR